MLPRKTAQRRKAIPSTVQRGVAWPDQRFSDNGDGTITDNMTGLVWLKDANSAGETKTWSDAGAYCEGTFAGRDDWRLPNIRELRSLINYGEIDPDVWLSNQGFENVLGVYYWTSRTQEDDTTQAWRIQIDGLPYVQPDYKSELFDVWPVRGNSPNIPSTMPAVRFSDNGDGTITDNLTGLTWLKNANRYYTDNPGDSDGGRVTWVEGFDYIDDLNAQNCCGYDDWGMPNVNELATLLEYGESPLNTWCSSQGFTDVKTNNPYWSSTTGARGDYSSAHHLSMSWGITMRSKVDYSDYLWPVRPAR